MTQSTPNIAGGAPQVVVLIEDDCLVRMVAAVALEDAGFKVLETQDADEALALLDARGAEVDAIFTDVNMPGSMDGLQLARRAHCRWPSIPILITSGKACPSQHELPGGSRFVAKPYNIDRIVSEVRDMISA